MRAQSLLQATLFLCGASDVYGDLLQIPTLKNRGLNYPMRSSQANFESAPDDLSPKPNIATRLKITSENGTHLECGLPADKFESGYAHFTNSAGVEDKHLFWWLFKARHDPDNAPVVMTLGGGPGASGLLFPFMGAGPCSISVDENGKGHASRSLYSWTEHVNLLAIDHPVGVGFSYGEHSSLRNTSVSAAWDTDDFLQTFWKEFPHLARNKFMVNGGSYGGIFVPNIISVIHTRNIQAKSATSAVSRIKKAPDSIMLVNVCSDPLTHHRWMHESLCNKGPEGNMFFNDTTCAELVSKLPDCLDSIQYSYQKDTLDSRTDAMLKCVFMAGEFWERFPQRDPYDSRTKCPEKCDYLSMTGPVSDVLNSTDIKDTIGVSRENNFKILATDEITMPFIDEGDMIQAAYRLLAPAIEDGMRLFVYNGMRDGACPWRSSLAWMRLLETKYQDAFREATEVEYSGVGTIRQVGAGAGNYTFIKVAEAGHMVIRSQTELVRHFAIQWLENKPFF